MRPMRVPPTASGTGWGSVAVVGESRRSPMAAVPSRIRKKRKLWAVLTMGGRQPPADQPSRHTTEVPGRARRDRGAGILIRRSAYSCQLVKALVKAQGEPGSWLQDDPEPKPGPGEVLIRVMGTGICG